MSYIITKKVYGIQIFLTELHFTKSGFVHDWSPKRREALQFKDISQAIQVNLIFADDIGEVIDYKKESPVKQPADAT